MLEKRSLLATVLFALTAAAPAVADDTPGRDRDRNQDRQHKSL